MQVYRLGAILIFAGCLFLWLLGTPLGGVQTDVQAAVLQRVSVHKATPTPYVPPAEQGGSVNLVCGAAILVMIILGGVIWTQRSLGETRDIGNMGDNESPLDSDPPER